MPAAGAPLRAEFFAFGKKSTHSHAVGDRVGALFIEMLGGNEFRLREVGGFAVGFNRANRRGAAFGGVDSRTRYRFAGALYTPPEKTDLTLFRAVGAKLCEAVGGTSALRADVST